MARRFRRAIILTPRSGAVEASTIDPNDLYGDAGLVFNDEFTR